MSRTTPRQDLADGHGPDRRARQRPRRRGATWGRAGRLRSEGPPPPGGAFPSAAEQKALAAEERTAIVRFLVIGLNVVTYWGWLAPSGLGRPGLAAGLSVVAFAYGLYDLVARPYRRFPILLTAAWTTVTDGLLIALWLLATGAFASPYYLLWYLSLVAVTFRYGWRAPLVAAGVYAATYTAVVAVEGQLAANAVDVAIRVGYILLCGGLGALLAQESARAFEARFRMDAKVREADRFWALAEASAEALVVSADDVVLECNQAYCRLIGLPREQLVGRRIADLVPPESRDALARHVVDPSEPLELWRNGPLGRQLLRVEARPIEYMGRTARFASLRDVTAERAAQRRADRTEAQLRLAVEAGQVGTWDLELASGRIECNQRFGQILVGDAPPKPWDLARLLRHVPEDDRASVADALDAAARDGWLDVEFRVDWPDGSRHWVSLQGQSRRDAQGVPVGLVGVARDATVSRTAEAARRIAHETVLSGKAREAKDRLAAVFDSSLDGILTKDLDGTITSWNPACEEMYGYSAPEAIGRPSTMLCVQGQEDEEERTLEQIRAGRPVLLREAERVRKDGTRIWVSVSASPLRDPAGKVNGCAAIMRDITSVRAFEKERAEAREASARLAAVVESSIDGILTKDLTGRIQSWNAACQRMFGYTAEEAIGKPITMLYPKGMEAEEENVLSHIRAGEPVRIREAERVRKDGSKLWVSVSASPVRDANGRIVGAAAIKRDVTEERAVERERQEAKERAQELARLQDVNRFKTQFINTAAHELRTPLLPLRMQLDLMMTDDAEPPTPAQREGMEIMRRNLERLAGLVEDLLTIARSQAGRIELEVERADLATLLEAAQENFQALASARGVDLAVDRPEGLAVHADPKRIQQVLSNLLGNAFKFTPAGGSVRVSARAEGAIVRVLVTDSGRGIARSSQSRLFQPFVQVHDTAMTQPGSGLGLYICKQIVELHGGTIGVESAGIGKGSTFWFTLPRPAPGPSTARPAADPAWDPPVPLPGEGPEGAA